MKLFRRKNGRKRWREKARLINPHKTQIILINTKSQEPRPDRGLWIEKKLNEFACSLNSQSSGPSTGISMSELAFAYRVRQENNLEQTHECDTTVDESISQAQ